MSDPTPDPTRSVNWSKEQIQFIVDIGHQKTASRIAQEFNAHFSLTGTALLTEKQATYIRTYYKPNNTRGKSPSSSAGRDYISLTPSLNSGTAMIGSVGSSGTQQSALPHSGEQSIMQRTQQSSITGENRHSSSGTPSTVGQAHTTDHHDNVGTAILEYCQNPEANKFKSQKSNRNTGTPRPEHAPANNESQPPAMLQKLAIVRTNAPHDNCDTDGPHHHEDDGGVNVLSAKAFMDTVARMKGPVMSLDSIADMMERLQLEDAEGKAAADAAVVPTAAGAASDVPHDTPHSHACLAQVSSTLQAAKDTLVAAVEPPALVQPQVGSVGQHRTANSGGHHRAVGPLGSLFDVGGREQTQGGGIPGQVVPRASDPVGTHGPNRLGQAGLPASSLGTTSHSDVAGHPAPVGSSDEEAHGSPHGHSSPKDAQGGNSSVSH
ncbi:hypothetical protein GE09DRAFT_1214557 [Coniochaeta sp. 2T2.1]|nr:hypothetical protein GE09DRAFT_1214557 [Coniochaeta sp. 2T2.1]